MTFGPDLPSLPWFKLQWLNFYVVLGVFCILFPNLFTFKQKLKASVHSHLLLLYSGLKKREANKRGGYFPFIAIAFFIPGIERVGSCNWAGSFVGMSVTIHTALDRYLC